MNFPARQVSQRYALVASVLVFSCFAILGKAAWIMTVDKNFWMAVSERFVKENYPVEPTRGNILASGGEVLAASLPEYKMYMDFMSWEKDAQRREKDQSRRDSILTHAADSIADGMHAIFPDIDPAEFKKHLMEGRAKESHHWQLYSKRITYIQLCQVRTLPLFRLSANSGGFHTENIHTRVNPYGRMAIRTIGDLYKGKDSARTGIEFTCDSILRGKPGIAHRQKVLNRYLTIIDKPAEDGCDVMTTLDVGMQDICEKALGDQLKEIDAISGVCILMEVATGDIKAMTSLRRLEDGSYQEINADAVKNLYEPGSVFKPMSFLVGMDDGYIHMTDKVDVGCGIKEMYGRKMRDANWRSGGSGVQTVPQILQKSLNVGVSTLIDRYYHDNPRKFVEGIYRIGVAEDLKIPIPGYAKPRIRMPKEDGSNWSKTALPWMSIGYETQIPPISTLNFYNGIANNGKMLRPRLIKAYLRDGEVIKEFPVEVLREQMAKPEAVKNIQECLESVVAIGSGKKARSSMFSVSGKTGTAQIWTKSGFSAQYLVSFAGYFPSDKPLYSCIVCIQKTAPASGGTHSAPVFKRVAETVMAQRRSTDYSSARDTLHGHLPLVDNGNINAASAVLDQLGVKHSAPADVNEGSVAWGTCKTTSSDLNLSKADAQNDSVVPDVRGYGLRDALFRLEQAGLKVKVKGVGSVSKQSIEAGSHFKRGECIELTLGDVEDLPTAEEPDSVQKQEKASEPEKASEHKEKAKTEEPAKKKEATSSEKKKQPADKPRSKEGKVKKETVSKPQKSEGKEKKADSTKKKSTAQKPNDKKRKSSKS